MLSFVWMEKAQNLWIVNWNVVLTLLNLQGVEFLGLYKPLVFTSFVVKQMIPLSAYMVMC